MVMFHIPGQLFEISDQPPFDFLFQSIKDWRNVFIFDQVVSCITPFFRRSATFESIAFVLLKTDDCKVVVLVLANQ